MRTDIRERFMDIAVEIIDHAQSCTTQASRRRIVDTLNRAYAAGAAEEREACVRVALCLTDDDLPEYGDEEIARIHIQSDTAKAIAAGIRARGEAE